ncbi:MAG: hypothetical protein M1540_00440 [Candidatus Bathyarchaeota archaeon]|nr:hypothetical protein [Candidatus Bathyarchaeota archaeon]
MKFGAIYARIQKHRQNQVAFSKIASKSAKKLENERTLYNHAIDTERPDPKLWVGTPKIAF